MDIPALSDLAAIPVSVITAMTLLIGLLLNVRSSNRARRVEMANVYFKVAERWTATLSLLYQVRNMPPPSLEELEKKYPNAKDFMATDEWRSNYRLICNFFEDMGLFVHNKNIPLGTRRVLVTISEDDYLLMKPVLDYLRNNYRQDIYIFWNYLLREAHRHDALRPFAGRKPYEPSRAG